MCWSQPPGLWLLPIALWLSFSQVLCGWSALPPGLYDCWASLPPLQTSHHEGMGTSSTAWGSFPTPHLVSRSWWGGDLVRSSSPHISLPPFPLSLPFPSFPSSLFPPSLPPFLLPFLPLPSLPPGWNWDRWCHYIWAGSMCNASSTRRIQNVSTCALWPPTFDPYVPTFPWPVCVVCTCHTPQSSIRTQQSSVYMDNYQRFHLEGWKSGSSPKQSQRDWLYHYIIGIYQLKYKLRAEFNHTRLEAWCFTN